MIKEKTKLNDKLSKVSLEYKNRYKEKYPKGLDLSPNSMLSKSLIDLVLGNTIQAHEAFSGRYDLWRKIDESLSSFIPIEVEVDNSENSGGEEQIDGTSKTKKVMIVPVSVAILETLLSQSVLPFLDLPYYRYDAVSPDEKMNTILLEKTVEKGSLNYKHGLYIINLFLDALKYGFGAVAVQWDRTRGKTVVVEEQGGDEVKTYKRTLKDEVIREGVELTSIDPYNFLFDTTVPIQEFQKGKYVGWIDRLNYTYLLRAELCQDSTMFNVRYLKDALWESKYYTTNKGNDKKTEMVRGQALESQPVDIIRQIIDIIPADYGLSESENPEKWMIAVAGDSIIIDLYKLEGPLNNFPVAILAPKFDGHSVLPTSDMETIWGLQDYIDFLYSSHITNIKKSINDMIVVDPKLIVMKDLLNPGPGKIIRLKTTAWGRGVRDAIEQLKVNDVTSSHVNDAQRFIEIMFNVSGASDVLTGQSKYRGERISATRDRGAQLGALTRIDRTIRTASIMTMTELGSMCAKLTQWNMSRDTYVKTTGRWEAVLKREFGDKLIGNNEYVKVSPFEIVGGFDIIHHDASVVGSEQVEDWLSIFQILASQPELGSQFDLGRIFLHIARQMGASNVQDFLKQEPLPTQAASGLPTEMGLQEALGGAPSYLELSEIGEILGGL